MSESHSWSPLEGRSSSAPTRNRDPKFAGMRRPAGLSLLTASRTDRGQSVLEMALVLPFFLVIVMGVIDFGWAFRDYITLTNSAREGARYAIVCPTNDTQIKDRVSTYSEDLVDSSGVSVAWEGGTRCTSENYVEVSASYDYYFITPLGGFLSSISGGALPDHLHLTSATRMRQE